MSGELLTWPSSSPTAVSDYQYQNAILAAVIAGFMRLSLTEWATSTIPQIAAGSIVEVGGSMYSFASAVSIAGTPADGTMYIRMEPSGSDANPTWSAVAPSWDMAKNGWYSGSYRYVAKMTRSGSSYTNKELYVNYPAAWIRSSMLPNGEIAAGKYGSRSIDSDDIALLGILEAVIGTGAVASSKMKPYTAGDNFIIEGNLDTPPDSTTLTKIGEIQLDKGGTLRIKFTMSCFSGGQTGGRIYRNGVAVGTLRTLTTVNTGTTYSQDISGWAAGDLCQLYGYAASGGGYQGGLLDFTLYAGNWYSLMDMNA